jgi:hypothetical protein
MRAAIKSKALHHLRCDSNVQSVDGIPPGNDTRVQLNGEARCLPSKTSASHERSPTFSIKDHLRELVSEHEVESNCERRASALSGSTLANYFHRLEHLTSSAARVNLCMTLEL